jgi:hypothetical protein
MIRSQMLASVTLALAMVALASQGDPAQGASRAGRMACQQDFYTCNGKCASSGYYHLHQSCFDACKKQLSVCIASDHYSRTRDPRLQNQNLRDAAPPGPPAARGR